VRDVTGLFALVRPTGQLVRIERPFDPRLSAVAHTHRAGARFASRRFAIRTICLSSKQVTVTPRTACAIPLSFFCVATTASADPVALAASLIGRPYVWGAEGPREFDCSGLTQYVFREYGVDLPRRAISQSRVGDPADRRLQRGDLVFFSSDAGGSLVTHVGIYEGDGMMIDASKRYGKVRRESLDDDYWVDRFLFAKRIADANDTVEIPEPSPRSPSPRGDRRKASARVLEQIADVLLRRPRR